VKSKINIRYKVAVGQLRCDSHMEDVMYEVVEEDVSKREFRVVYHVTDSEDDDGSMLVHDSKGLKESCDLQMWISEMYLVNDPLWVIVDKDTMPSF
jgi:hypothetical protein